MTTSVPKQGLSCGLWQDIYKGVNRIGLRWFIQSGEVILTPDKLKRLKWK